MPDAGILEAKDLIQVNATMIVGILIFYTIPYIIKGVPPSNREHWYDTAVLILIASAITLFAASAISTMVSTVYLSVSESLTICGLIAITIAIFIFIQVIKVAKTTIKKAREEGEARKTLPQVEFRPNTNEETQKEKEAEERKAGDAIEKQNEELQKDQAKKESEPVQQTPKKDEMSEEPQKDEKVIEESKRFEVLPWTREEDERNAIRGS
jgi:hypothetical protein